MAKCVKCGHQNSQTNDFCSECGASLDKISRTSDVSRQKSGKFSAAKVSLLAALLILVIAGFTGYQLLSKKYSEAAVIDQFKQALVQRDKQSLKHLINPDDSRLKINDQSLEALFSLMDKNPSLIEDIELGLKKEALGEELFFTRKNGSKLLLFDQYVIDTNGYYVALKSSVGPSTIYLNDKEIGVLENEKEEKEFGPLLAGSYTFKGVSDKKEDELTIDLAGTKNKVDMALNTGKPKEEKKKENQLENKQETVVIYKEADKSDPVYSHYLIPHSDYAYLQFEDIKGMSKRELRLARNEIYARHGYVFESKDLQDYFDSQAWYSRNPSYKGALTAVEEHNVDYIKSFE